MKQNIGRSYPLWFKTTTILLGLVLAFVVLSYGKFILMPLAFSALIAMLLEPLSKWLQEWKIHRAGAIIISMVLLFLLLSGILSLLSLQLLQFADSLPKANEKIQTLGNDIIQFFEATFNIAPNRQVEFIRQGLETVLNESGKYVTTALGATTNVFTTMALLPIFVFFMMYYKNMYRRFLYMMGDGGNRAIDSVIDSVQKVTQNYIIGMMTVITLLAILNFIGLWAIGIEHALFFAVFAAILAIIPYIGIIIGSLPAIIFALLFTDSLFYPVAVIGVFAVVQFLEGNFITPNVVGSRVSINPFMALLGLIVGGNIWGIAGMILFVPFIGILKCIFDEVESLRPYGYLLGNNPETESITDEEKSDGASE